VAEAGGAIGYSKRSRLDKLGVEPGMRVAVLGLRDPVFAAELKTRVGAYATRLPKAADMVLVFLDAKTALPKLARAWGAIAPNGSIWAVWPKGRKEFREDDIRAFGPAAGLVDVKVMAFPETLSGLKLVIPLRDRK